MLTGTKAEVEHDAARMRPPGSEVQRLCAGIEKVKRVTGWSPQTAFDDGLQITIEWLRGTMTADDAVQYHY
jgi:dTDP-glucose 4,6-dehydratase